MPNKYFLYENSVQDAPDEENTLSTFYRRINHREPRVFREDFCGTFRNSCEWVRKNRNDMAIAIDLDPEPLNYGLKYHVSQLKDHQKKRLKVINKNVLDVKNPKSDIIAACNISYCVFKKRQELLKYFRSSYRALKSKGIWGALDAS